MGVAIVAARSDEPKPRWGLEVAGGQCRYGSSPDGMWWQSDQEHSNRYKTNGCMQFGGALYLNPAWAVTARAINLGHAGLNALAVACPGDDCSKSNPALDKQRAACAGKFTEDCLYRWKGAGDIKGVLFGFRAKALSAADFSVEPELGVFVYRARWSAQVYPLTCSSGADNATCPWRIEAEQKSGYYVSPEAGLMLRYKYLFAGTQYFFRTTQHTNITAGIGGPAQTWIAGVTVNF